MEHCFKDYKYSSGNGTIDNDEIYDLVIFVANSREVREKCTERRVNNRQNQNNNPLMENEVCEGQ